MGSVADVPQQLAVDTGRPVGLAAQGVAARFGDKVVLADVSLEIGTGKLVGVVGPNGAGKTTLLRVLAGLHPPAGGTVVRLGATAVTRTRRRRIGYLPDEAALFDELTGLENLRLFAWARGSPLDTHDCLALAERLGLAADALTTRVSTYSFGMRRKVAIAQTLTGNPGLLLLDEPTIGLDPEGRSRLAAELQTRLDRCAVLIASHDLRFVQDLAHRVLFIDRGRIVLAGRPAELLKPVDEEVEFSLATRDTYRPIAVQEIQETRVDERHVRFRSTAGMAGLSPLIQAVLHAGNEIESIEVRRADLSDVFRRVTGRDWNTA
jgi:ABC-type multidrug transport system ATPase subunit